MAAPYLELQPKNLALPSRNAVSEEWIDKLRAWLPPFIELLRQPVSDEDRVGYNDALVSHLGTIAAFEYLARKERDRALAKGYALHPKSSGVNATEQEGLVRNYASEEDRLHKLLKDLHDAAKTRLSVGQTNLNFLRAHIETGGA